MQARLCLDPQHYLLGFPALPCKITLTGRTLLPCLSMIELGSVLVVTPSISFPRELGSKLSAVQMFFEFTEFFVVGSPRLGRPTLNKRPFVQSVTFPKTGTDPGQAEAGRTFLTPSTPFSVGRNKPPPSAELVGCLLIFSGADKLLFAKINFILSAC